MIRATSLIRTSLIRATYFVAMSALRARRDFKHAIATESQRRPVLKLRVVQVAVIVACQRRIKLGSRTRPGPFRAHAVGCPSPARKKAVALARTLAFRSAEWGGPRRSATPGSSGGASRPASVFPSSSAAFFPSCAGPPRRTCTALFCSAQSKGNAWPLPGTGCRQPYLLPLCPARADTALGTRRPSDWPETRWVAAPCKRGRVQGARTSQSKSNSAADREARRS